jgi:hypothetical protein
MMNDRATIPQRFLTFLAAVLVLRVTATVVLKYVNYLPPNFESEFLRGRDSYFFGSYGWAFYVHIASGPVSLVLGMILLSERFRKSFPKWHRTLGRVQIPVVLFLVAPSGLWMAYRAEAGPLAGAGFAVLAIATGISAALGWRAAVKRRFADHRRWMWRCYLLLCSTVVLRLIGGLGTVLAIQALWIDTLAAWVSWLGPLAAFEVATAIDRKIRRSLVH